MRMHVRSPWAIFVGLFFCVASLVCVYDYWVRTAALDWPTVMGQVDNKDSAKWTGRGGTEFQFYINYKSGGHKYCRKMAFRQLPSSEVRLHVDPKDSGNVYSEEELLKYRHDELWVVPLCMICGLFSVYNGVLVLGLANPQNRLGRLSQLKRSIAEGVGRSAKIIGTRLQTGIIVSIGGTVCLLIILAILYGIADWFWELEEGLFAIVGRFPAGIATGAIAATIITRYAIRSDYEANSRLLKQQCACLIPTLRMDYRIGPMFKTVKQLTTAIAAGKVIKMFHPMDCYETIPPAKRTGIYAVVEKHFTILVNVKDDVVVSIVQDAE